MMIDVPFTYTTLYVFHLILRFGDKRSIKIENLFNSRDELLKNVLEDYYSNNSSEYNEDNDWEDKIQFKEIKEEQELDKMLKSYPEIFYEDDGKIFISDDISLDDIMILLKEFNMPTHRFYNASDSEKFYKSIEITEIFEYRKKYKEYGYTLEKQIEEAYINNVSFDKLKLLLYKRFIFLFKVGITNEQYVLEYLNLPDESEQSILIDKDFDYYLNSEYIKNGEEYPIDKDIYENSDFYEDIVECFNPIQFNIEEDYQYAIFGNGPLFDRKYDESFTKLSMSDQFNKNEEYNNVDYNDLPSFDEIDIYYEKQYAKINFDIEEEEFAFYVVYIKKLNDLIESGRKEFINVRNRVLYMLDDIKYCLFMKENVDKYYEKSINYEFDEDSFEFFASEAQYFIEDAFEGKTGKTIEKLLFTSTYYQLTKDEYILELLERYKSDYRYESYSQIILGKNKGYSKIKKN